MPSLKNNKNKWSLPANTEPIGVRCICVPVPNDPEWIAKFYGAIYTLSQQIWWDRDAAHTAQVVAKRWEEVYLTTLAGDCGIIDDCDDCLDRIIYNPRTGRLGRQTDVGFYEFPDGPWGTSMLDPVYGPPQPWVGGTSEDKRCLAARNAALVLKSLYNETWQNFINWSVGGAFTFMRDVMQTFGGFLNAVFDTDWLLLKAQELHAEQSSFADQFDDGQFETIQNILYCASSVDGDGVVSFDVDYVLAELVDAGGSPYAGLVFLISLYLGESGLNAAGGIHNEDTADCECAVPWCLRYGDVDLDFDVWSPFISSGVVGCSTLASYSPNHWLSAIETDCALKKYRSAGVKLNIGATTVTKIEVVYSSVAGDFSGYPPNRNNNIHIQGWSGGVYQFDLATTSVDGSNQVFTWSGTANIDEVRFQGLMSDTTNAGLTGAFAIEEIHIEGTGTFPTDATPC